MRCSELPVNLGTFGQVLGSLTDYDLASADEDDLSVLRSIAPSHHGYIVEINPNGLCFEIGALHPRCHCRKLSLPGLILLQFQIALALPARAARQLPDQSINSPQCFGALQSPLLKFKPMDGRTNPWSSRRFQAELSYPSTQRNKETPSYVASH
jgi:hypothetical protein